MNSAGIGLVWAANGCIFFFGVIILIASIVLCAVLAPVLLIPLLGALVLFGLVVLQAGIN